MKASKRIPRVILIYKGHGICGTDNVTEDWRLWSLALPTMRDCPLCELTLKQIHLNVHHLVHFYLKCPQLSLSCALAFLACGDSRLNEPYTWFDCSWDATSVTRGLAKYGSWLRPVLGNVGQNSPRQHDLSTWARTNHHLSSTEIRH